MKKTKKISEELMEFGVGGSIGEAIGAATALIPGVGKIISPILTPILGAAGEMVEQKIEEKKNPKSKLTTENQEATNFLGNFKSGGPVPKSIKDTYGGNLKHIVDDVYISQGRKHSEGGIKGDTNLDGKPEIEFEDGELYYDSAEDGGFFVNADSSKKYLKSFSKGTDKLAKDTNNIVKKLSILENESKRTARMAESLLAKESELPKMWKGGTYKVPNKFRPTGIVEDVFLPNASYMGNPAGYSFATDTNKVGGETARVEGRTGADTMGARYARASSDAGNLVDTDYFSDAPKKMANTDGVGAEGMKMTTGDKAILAGQAIPAVYNLARGLFDKAEVVDPAYHPYEDKVISLMKDRSYNPATVQREIDYTVAAGKQGIAENTSSASVARSNMQQLFSNAAREKAGADLTGQQMNNQFKAELANTYDQFGRMRLDAEAQADQATWANQVAKDDYISTGISQLGAGADAYGNALNKKTTNEILMNILGNSAGNYTIDAKGNITFKNAV